MRKKSDLEKSNKNYFIIKSNDFHLLKIVISSFIVFLLLIYCLGGILFIEKNEDHSNFGILENREIIQEEKVKENLANMKGFFTKNEGQLDNDEIYFTYSSQDKIFGFCESSVLIKLSKTLEDNKTKSSIIKITFENSNKVIPVGKEVLNHKTNYFIGNDSSKWKSNVPNYEKIIYKNLYDGIDLVYYFNEKGLKYDWIVKSFTNPNQIIERFEGIVSTKIDSNGELIIETNTGEFREQTPIGYQIIDGVHYEVNIAYVVNDVLVTYDVSSYDTSIDLIIDPLIYSTYIGGSGGDDSGGSTIDSDGNLIFSGGTYSKDFPTTQDCYDETKNGGRDAFILKLNSDGSDLIFSTFIGGSNHEYMAGSICIDSMNNIYFTGGTASADFPTTNSAYDTTFNGDHDIFSCKLNDDGSKLIYSTFIGSEGVEYGWSNLFNKLLI